MDHVNIWTYNPERLRQSLAECGLVPDDVISLCISEKSNILILREDWSGNLDELRTRLKENLITHPLFVRLETKYDKGVEI